MHRTDGTVEGWETPVTQLYLVGSVNDRVEFDRVAVNADWGRREKERVHSSRAVSQYRCVRRRTLGTVTTGANIKENYQYTADKRKGRRAPNFLKMRK